MNENIDKTIMKATEKKEKRGLIVTRQIFTDVDRILKDNREGYRAYKAEFDETQLLVEPSKPSYVVIELNNYCNMRCKMCLKSLDANANGKDNMSMEVLEKLLKDANEIGVKSFFVGGGTECLINPNIKEMLKKVKEIGKGIDDVLITNGYALTPEITDILIDLQWEKCFISIDAATQETYKRIRGKELKVVEDNVNYLIKRRNERKSIFPIIRVSFCIQEDNYDEIEDFTKKWKEKVDIIDFQNVMDFSDMIVREDLPDTDKKCDQPFNRLMVDCNGNVFPCCVEWGKNIRLGNIKDATLGEMWNGEKINILRKQIKEGKLCNVCKSCLNSMSDI